MTARFAPPRRLFVPRPPPADPDEDNGEALPAPTLLRARARRLAGIREARGCLAHFPGPGESLHCVATARFDLSDLVGLLLDRSGPCRACLVATLSYNDRNLRHLLRWLDSGAVRSLGLLCSIFFRSHKLPLWEETLAAFRERGQRAACVHSHAKVITLAFDSGLRLAVEGSANLAGNGSGREQFCLVNDPGLHDWHTAWIKEQLSRGEAKEKARADEASA